MVRKTASFFILLVALLFPFFSVLALNCVTLQGVPFTMPDDGTPCPTNPPGYANCIGSGCAMAANVATAVKSPSKDCQEYCSNVQKYNPPSGTACFCRVGPQSLSELINRITKYMLWVALFGAPLVVILGAFMIATARDNPEQVNKGRNMIIWAVIGLAVFLIAKILGNVIITAFGGG